MEKILRNSLKTLITLSLHQTFPFGGTMERFPPYSLSPVSTSTSTFKNGVKSSSKIVVVVVVVVEIVEVGVVSESTSNGSRKCYRIHFNNATNCQVFILSNHHQSKSRNAPSSL